MAELYGKTLPDNKRLLNRSTRKQLFIVPVQE